MEEPHKVDVREAMREVRINVDVREAMRCVLTGTQFDDVLAQVVVIREARTEVKCLCCGFINTDRGAATCASPACGCSVGHLWIGGRG